MGVGVQNEAAGSPAQRYLRIQRLEVSRSYRRSPQMHEELPDGGRRGHKPFPSPNEGHLAVRPSSLPTRSGAWLHADGSGLGGHRSDKDVEGGLRWDFWAWTSRPRDSGGHPLAACTCRVPSLLEHDRPCEEAQRTASTKDRA